MVEHLNRAREILKRARKVFHGYIILPDDVNIPLEAVLELLKAVEKMYGEVVARALLRGLIFEPDTPVQANLPLVIVLFYELQLQNIEVFSGTFEPDTPVQANLELVVEVS